MFNSIDALHGIVVVETRGIRHSIANITGLSDNEVFWSIDAFNFVLPLFRSSCNSSASASKFSHLG